MKRCMSLKKVRIIYPLKPLKNNMLYNTMLIGPLMSYFLNLELRPRIYILHWLICSHFRHGERSNNLIYAGVESCYWAQQRAKKMNQKQRNQYPLVLFTKTARKNVDMGRFCKTRAKALLEYQCKVTRVEGLVNFGERSGSFIGHKSCSS